VQKPVVRTSFDPFAVTENGPQACAPCAAAASQASVALKPVEMSKFKPMFNGCAGCQTAAEAAAPIQQAKFNPMAVTETKVVTTSTSCGPCEAAAAAAKLIPLVPIAQTKPNFNPFAITENGQQVVAAKQSPTVPNKYYHNDNYSMLAGELHYNPRTDTWRLRYATVDIVDVFGGSVTLSNAANRMQGYQSGQMVLIEGEVAEMDATSVSPSYKIRHVWPVK
jgi:hypothetical protein